MLTHMDEKVKNIAIAWGGGAEYMKKEYRKINASFPLQECKRDVSVGRAS